MIDNKRKALDNGKTLFLNENIYTIVEEIGRGASCIVYNAVYLDTGKHRHYVRIKECFPYYLDIKRAEDGSLNIEESIQNEFDCACEKFKKAYERNISLKQTLGLMNSTVDAVNLFSSNHTLYSVMTCAEGNDYRSPDADKNLQSVFIRMRTLAKIIKKYHDHGILYLDIKPENIFLIPETKELMMLFDFDSLILKEDLKNRTVVSFPYSKGYSAPELSASKEKQWKISEAADIYSIGAVVFDKLFGRTPDPLDRSINSSYDFTLMNNKDERYQPDLFRELTVFFHKTVTSSISHRYKDMDEVISALEQLISLSDIESAFLFYQFSYNSACFFGRESEINQISEIFNSGQQVLFLSGIGGIGKTELAKRYAYEYAEQYRKIVFVPFSGSIKETVCGNYLNINTIKQGEEDDDTYFNRKLAVLKTVVSLDDLIILDNFDVDCDEHLEALFECPCKFLVTSREDFRDFGYKQLNVGRIEDLDELLMLVKTYYSYAPEDEEEINNLIELVDWHTMTVELIAKYLRTTNTRPQILTEMLMEKEGITSTEEIHIKHRKDRKLRAESISSHLLVLFNLSGFSKGQRELIRSLSLLGYVRIAKEKFLSYCPIENNQDELDALIRQGWIEYDSLTNKVSLHQIILDLVYNYMYPDSENCPHILCAMTEYLARELPNYTEKKIRRKLINLFMQRIKGKDLAYAELCVYYCQNIRKNPRYLDEAEQICLIHSENEANDLMQKICRMNIKIAGTQEDISKKMIEEDDFDENSYFSQTASVICELADQAYAYAQKFSCSPAYLGRFCVELANELDEASVANLFTMVLEGNNDSMNRILDKAVMLLDKAEEYLLNAKMRNEEKIKLFRTMQEFFSPDNFSSLYRSEHYSDTERMYHYQKIIDYIRDGNDEVIDLSDISISDLAEDAGRKGDFSRAIELYKKACREDDGLASYYLDKIAHIYYWDMGETKKAEDCFKQILEQERASEQLTHYYAYYICNELIHLLLKENRKAEARKYSEELTHAAISHIDNKDYLKWIIVGYYWQYKTEDSDEKKQEYWQNCTDYFSQISGEEKLPEELKEFLLDLARHQEKDEEKIIFAFNCLDHIEIGYHSENFRDFFDYILQVCQDKPEFVSYQIRALLNYSEYLMDSYSEEDSKDQKEHSFAYYIKANELYQQNKIEDPYLDSLLHQTLAKYYDKFTDNEYERIEEEKNKCNYLLLTERKADGKSKKQQIELWESAANEYHYLDNFIMENECYNRLFAIFSSDMNLYDKESFEQYWRLAMAQIRCYSSLKETQPAKDRIWFLCEKAFHHYREADKEKESQRKRKDFSQKLDDCAEHLLEMGWESEAFGLFILSLILKISEKAFQEYIQEIFSKFPDFQMRQIADKDKEELLFSKFSAVLRGSINNQNIDDIVNRYERIKPILEKDKTLKKFADELEWFSASYQHKDIEFKR